MFSQDTSTQIESPCEAGLYLRIVEPVDVIEPRDPEDDDDEQE
jgi:hypothetical protein